MGDGGTRGQVYEFAALFERLERLTIAVEEFVRVYNVATARAMAKPKKPRPKLARRRSRS